MDMKVRFVLSFVILVVCSSICTAQLTTLNPNILTQSKNLGDCQACNLFIDSFKRGLERTSRGKFEGGDTAWEEEKLNKTYKRSEVRLVDIQEGICSEIKKHSVQCHHVAEKAEEFIEEWWAQDPNESDDLFSYICIDKMKVCCPKLHYGKYCTPCHGDHKNICNGNGKCRGDGTRKGNGTCLCDTGYTGDHCEECALGYYLSYKDDTKMLCSACHPTCMGGCRDGSQKDCVACMPGFKLDVEHGCMDVNECYLENICKPHEFCVNKLGTHDCKMCDKSCDGCFGEGPDVCYRCSSGYSKKGDLCIEDRVEIDEDENYSSTRKEEL